MLIAVLPTNMIKNKFMNETKPIANAPVIPAIRTNRSLKPVGM
jgi:hypothetical protein